MTERYEFEYGDGTVYRRVVDLVTRYRLEDGEVVVDVGCGFGVIAEPLASLSLTYIGLDCDPVAVAKLREQSIEAEVVDFSEPERAVQALKQRLGDRKLAAVVMIDSLEHMTNGEEVLKALQQLAVTHRCAPLVLAVPNVTHVDLVGKLLLGRWDVTKVGLLDDTHVAFFSEGRLQTVMQRSGWLQVAASDFELPESDQHFPPDAAVLQTGAPLRDLLVLVREQASGSAMVNEFVRAYSPVATPPLDDGEPRPDAPLLSVLIRTQNTRPATLQEALLALAAQTCQDFEVLLLPHNVPKEDLFDLRYLVDAFPPTFSERVRIVPVDGGGRSRPLNVGIGEVKGQYVAILDDDDVVFGHWVESFRKAADKRPGRVLRAVAAEQDVEPITWSGSVSGYDVASRPYCRWSTKFDVIEHLVENHSPPCGWAIPRSAFRDLGLRFDETLPVLEDWDVLIQAALWSGVFSIEDVTALWRRWKTGDSSTSVHSENEWIRARMAVLAKLDGRPLLLPAHSITKLHEMSDELSAAKADRDRLTKDLQRTEQDRLEIHDNLLSAHRRLLAVHASTSWKLSKPFRAMGSLARRTMGRRT